MKAILFFNLLLVTFTSQANQPQDLNISDEVMAYRRGAVEAPIMQCPRLNPKYEKMLGQLNELKRRIKNDACKKDEIEAINEDVASLEEVLGSKRQNFVSIVRKVINENGQLSSKDITEVNTYVENVVLKTAKITGLVKNSACFPEDEKHSKLSFLASLVGDISGAVSVLTGPFGAKIALGGQVISGVMGSLGTIFTARETYDFNNIKDLTPTRNYLQTLCAYYSMKSDIDRETKFSQTRKRLAALVVSSDKLIKQLAWSCEECEAAIDEYVVKFAPRDEQEIWEEFVEKKLLPVSSLSPELIRASGQGVEFEVLAEPALGEESVELEFGGYQSSNTFDAENLTQDKTKELLFSFVDKEESPRISPAGKNQGPSGLDDEEDHFSESADLSGETVMEEPVMASSPEQDKVYDSVVKSLRTRSWALQELKKLEEDRKQNRGDDSLRSLVDVQKQIENLLVKEEAANYLKALSRRLKKDFSSFRSAISREGNQFFHLIKRGVIGQLLQGFDGSSDADVRTIHILFEEDLDFAQILYRASLSEEASDLLDRIQEEIPALVDQIVIDLELLEKRCLFFQTSLFKNFPEPKRECKKSLRIRGELEKFLKGLDQSNYAIHHWVGLDYEAADSQAYAKDWLDSITRSFDIRSEALSVTE